MFFFCRGNSPKWLDIFHFDLLRFRTCFSGSCRVKLIHRFGGVDKAYIRCTLFFWDGQEGTKTVRNLLYFRFFYGLVISVADETPAEPFKRYYCWKILQKCWLVGDMLVAWRVYYPVICRDYFINHYKDPYQLAKFPTNCIRIRRYFRFPIIYWIS